ncbi:MAG: small ribosomal subunit Rsm22 family protein [Blastocatellia bacterium]|nr:small ribosomal subunit Rsm22 family protein [Blastocatellia bacterium]
MNQSLSKLEDILISLVLGPEALAQHEQGKIGKKHLEPAAQALVRMSEQFTNARETLPANYWQGAGRAAYLLYYLPVNFAKAWAILNEIKAGDGLQPSDSGLHVMDVGCGPGTASLATLFFLAAHNLPTPVSVSFTLLDASAAAVQDARTLLRRAAEVLNQEREVVRLSLETRSGNVATAQFTEKTVSTSLIWVGNVLNETVQHGQGIAWLDDLLTGQLAEHGTAVLFEPALRETSRNLMQVRDDLLERHPELNVFAPCTADGPCRMLRDGKERDWCHSDVTWTRPALVTQLDELTGLWKKSLKFSYLALRRDGLRLQHEVAPPRMQAWRIVGDLLKEKGKEKIAACGPESAATLVRLKRDRSAANYALNHAERGALFFSSSLAATGHPPLAKVQSETDLTDFGPFLRTED